ncbi:NAD(P)/FAD-dependent oxidoreductase [Mycolicibacterium porcinum]|uniref:FAD-binding protein n=1 Tax=Mycolicibacterium porcinum TaxID=39693 RepID=A0AAW5T911_9MYCO|nr:FAD-dependent oxidoreductase [Mycolicibacterium porcinum]MCV7390748.1 FAD-binding protein [Mycolicibacterium porcinum]CDO29423.1 2-polyprenyl-6-methoxyphenol hydroxylase-like oxidoreductase [Mycolicibacterium vulneris]
MTEHSVVLGAGIAGLLAAAALADAGHDVTVIERDHLPDNPSQRRCVPQGPHLHSLLSRGWQTIEELVPGLIEDLITAGGHVLDDAHLGARMHIQNGPYAFNRTEPVADPAALANYLVTRPLLEHALRLRVMALPNVVIKDGHEVGELVAGQPDRITGVTLADRQTGATQTLEADLVVDATGRATRTPLLLETLHYDRPPQRSFTVRGVYYSQQIAIPDQDAFPERLVLVIPSGGAGRGGLIAGENDTWTLTIAAHTDKPAPPTTYTEMLTLAEQFVPSHIQPALRRAMPVSDVAVYRYPGGTWHRYDRCVRHPQGLVVIGDALCCLDPIHGQGVTMAARHAQVLRSHLRDRGSVDPQRFYQSLAHIIAPVWAANQPTGHTPGRSVKSRVRRRALDWSRRKILEAAGDIVVTERLVRIVNMVDPPQRLLEPRLLGRVAAYHFRRACATVGPLRVRTKARA